MLSENNGNVKWTQFITVSLGLLTIVVTVALWGINSVVANDRLREKGDMELKESCHDEIIQRNEVLFSIEKRLTRIEARLDYAGFKTPKVFNKVEI